MEGGHVHTHDHIHVRNGRDRILVHPGMGVLMTKKKTEKTELITCEKCRYWHQMGEHVDGICKVSSFQAYRKRNQFCNKAIKRNTGNG